MTATCPSCYFAIRCGVRWYSVFGNQSYCWHSIQVKYLTWRATFVMSFCSAYSCYAGDGWLRHHRPTTFVHLFLLPHIYIRVKRLPALTLMILLLLQLTWYYIVLRDTKQCWLQTLPIYVHVVFYIIKHCNIELTVIPCYCCSYSYIIFSSSFDMYIQYSDILLNEGWLHSVMLCVPVHTILTFPLQMTDNLCLSVLWRCLPPTTQWNITIHMIV